ncbi:hypothetical protein VNO77_23348 [Canavalia gladiata]|uniref:Uncharacterized protein n=1 Tax=Canavalia gladiata TaxID=3824 RepID=A0AAN9L9H7_CANGL
MLKEPFGRNMDTLQMGCIPQTDRMLLDFPFGRITINFLQKIVITKDDLPGLICYKLASFAGFSRQVVLWLCLTFFFSCETLITFSYALGKHPCIAWSSLIWLAFQRLAK